MALLHRFGLEHGADAQSVQALLQAGDTEGAHRTAHTLKGLAGTLGLSAVQQSAAALEQRLKQAGGPTEPAELNQLATRLNTLAPWLRALGNPAGTPPAPRAAVDPASLAPPLQALRELLRTDDVRAVTAYAALADQLRTLHPEAAGHLDQQLADYALDQALITLDTLLAEVPALRGA